MPPCSTRGTRTSLLACRLPRAAPSSPAASQVFTPHPTPPHLLAPGPLGPASSPQHSSAKQFRGQGRSEKPLRSFALCLRANDRRLPDHNTVGAVVLDADEVARLCAPIHLPPPGVPRADVARLLGISPQALTARVRHGHLVKHQPFAAARADRKHGEAPRPNVFYHAPPPHHLVAPVADTQSADWGSLNQNLHQRPRQISAPRSRLAGDPKGPTSPAPPWHQTLHRTVRQLHPNPQSLNPNSRKKYERFEWHCPDCDQYAQRLYWPFRPLTLPAYLGFDFTQLAPELPPAQIINLQSKIKNEAQPFTPGFTCRPCLIQQFGGRGLTYESTEFTSHNGKHVPKNTWHLFIQRLTMNLLTGREVHHPNA